ncbi:MAG TPA: M17 family peptidase N-terminal domain-containing protein, partial [Actinomycetota bacterium]|nr:M17 family peptidase N-terminal domain-containing protein [Actinomycetota bacterium]
MPKVISVPDAATQAPCSVLLVAAFKGDAGPTLSPDAAEVDAALDGRVADFMRVRGFRADVGDVLAMPTPEITADSVGVVGLGDKLKAGVTELRRAAGSSIRSLDGPPSVASTLHRLVPGGDGESAVVEGMLLGSYRFDQYKSKGPVRHTEQIALLGASQEGIDRGRVRAAAITRARDLINEPASTLNPTSLAVRVQELAADSGLECTVVDENELAARGFGGILGVGKGSD